MTEQGKPDHWAKLASQLGAEPRPEEGERRPAQQQPLDEAVGEVYSTGSEPGPSRPAPKPQRTAEDWSRLAAELGVVPPPEATADEIQQRALAGSSEELPGATGVPPVRDPEHGQDARATPRQPELALAEAGPVLTDDRGFLGDKPSEVSLDTSMAVNVEPVGADAFSHTSVVATPAKDPGTEAVDKKSGKRHKKRRRRPYKSRAENSVPATNGGHVTDVSEDPSDLGQDELAPPAGEGDVLPSDSSATGQAEALDRTKRRRRRRGSGRKRAALSQKANSAESHSEQDAAVRDEASADLAGAASSATDAQAADVQRAEGEEKHQPSGRAGDSKKPGHRGIPSWKEAVDIIISSNLAARAKSPNRKPAPRSRAT